MKQITSVFFCILLSFALPAQSPTLLYGLSSGGIVGGFYLASLDPATGLVTEISPQPLAQSVYACYATIDPVNDIYYFFVPDTLIGVSTSTGLIVSRAAYAPNTYFQMPQYNCRDSLIYGLYSSLTDTNKLATINPQTGNISIISPLSLDLGFINSTRGSLDPSAGIYYFHGVSSYKGVSLSTGQIVYSCTTNPPNLFEMSLWDCEDSALFGFMIDPVTGALIPSVMDMQTGALTNITTTSVPSTGYYMCTAEINSAVDLFHYSDVAGFRTFNMTSGSLIASVPLTFSQVTGTRYFDWIARDNCKCFLAPIGIEESSTQQFQLLPNPAEAGTQLTMSFGATQKDRLLQIFNMQGQLISQQEVSAGSTFSLISTANLFPGCYYASMDGGSPAKFIVQ
ncbi:MAG: T9SS type A sorting domain-containing protein [Bacteroidia bacterium]